MKWHERTWHFTSVHKFRVFFCSVYRFHGLPEFTRWFSLSKPPVSREESDFLVRRVLLIWKRAMRQFFGRVEDLSESSILSYFLSLFINASPKLAMSWECVQWCPNSPSIFVCFCFRIQRWTELRNFCFVASTTVSVRVGVTSKTLQTSLRSPLERKICRKNRKRHYF